MQTERIYKIDDRIIENMKKYKEVVLLPNVKKIQDSIEKEER